MPAKVKGPTDHVVVVGAGLAGLSAALRLAGAGRKVTVVDRITEVFWVLALYKIGADLYLLIAVAVFALLQEYLRARAAGLGLAELGIVTFAERPVRASFIFVSLIAWQLKMPIINQITLLWLFLQVVSFMMVSKFTYQHLN